MRDRFVLIATLNKLQKNAKNNETEDLSLHLRIGVRRTP